MRASLFKNLFITRFGVIAAVASLVGVFGFAINSEYVWAVGCGFSFVICLCSIKHMAEIDRTEIQRLITDLQQYESLRFDEACAKIADSSVPVARELARFRKFQSPQPPTRHRYFERDEIVFRVEQTQEGLARFVFQQNETPNHTAEPTSPNRGGSS